MKKFWILLVVCSLASMANAIEVSGNQSGTWSVDNNPYQLVGDVTVPSGSTLTIDAGVNVEALGEYRINVEGSIVAVGTETNGIHFYSPDESLWTGLRLDSTEEGNLFEYCTIEHAEDGINTMNTQVAIRHCHFNGNETGIHVFGLGNPDPPEVIIDENLIENCQQNGIIVYEHNPVITYNEVRQCALDQTARAGIQLACQSTGGICHPQILGNHIHNNVWQGITGWDIYADGDISPIVKGNLIEENLTGVYLYNASGYFENNIIRNNFVAGNANSGAGVMLYGSTTYPTFCQNIITGNFTGFYIINGADGDLGDVVEGTGRNLIYGNVDESDITHSVYSASSQSVYAQQCFWDSTVPAEIEETITGSVIFEPTYSDEHTAVAFITGRVLAPEPPDVIAQLVDANLRTVVATGYTTADSTYFLPVPYAGDFYVHVIETEPELPREGVYGGADSAIMLNIEEQTITTGIDIEELVDELPMYRAIEEPFTYEGMQVFPYRLSRSIFWLQDYLLHDDENGVQIIGFVDYSQATPQTSYTDVPCWLLNSDPQPGDTWASACLGNELTVRYLTAEVTPYGGDDELIVDYTDDDSDLVFRRRFVMDSGLMGEKVYAGWNLVDDYQVDYTQGVGQGYMAIAEGSLWHVVRDMDHAAPMNLTYWPQQDNVYRLMWDPPFPLADGTPWVGYHVYHNDVLLLDLVHGEFWTDIEVPGGINEYYVTAYSSIEETDPSNTVTIELQSIGDEPDPQPDDILTAHIFPNPSCFASGSGISMSIASPDAPVIHLYNNRGQRVRSWTPERGTDSRYEIRWDGADQAGKRVASGIYFARIASSRQTLVKKIVLLR